MILLDEYRGEHGQKQTLQLEKGVSARRSSPRHPLSRSSTFLPFPVPQRPLQSPVIPMSRNLAQVAPSRLHRQSIAKQVRALSRKCSQGRLTLKELASPRTPNPSEHLLKLFTSRIPARPGKDQLPT